MSAFAGLASFDGRSISGHEEDELRSILGRRHGGNPEIQRLGDAVFACGAGALRTARDTLFVADARLDNAREAAAAAGLSGDGPELIEALFAARGKVGIASLLGAFAFAHWDQDARCLTLGRDCMGRRPLFFHRGEDFVAFASLLPDLLAMPQVPRRIDEVMMASFLALDHRETTATFYQGIARVPTRSWVRIEPTRTDVHAYWAPDLKARRNYAREEDYVQEARERLDRAVARTLRDTPRAALLVSGGLDSSAIAATAARLGYGGGECYTAVAVPSATRTDDENVYADERPKVEALARLYPQLRFRFVAPASTCGIHQATPRWFLDFALPNRNASDMNWFYGLRQHFMADGHRVAVVGTMGNYALSWDGHFSLPALARAGRIGAMLTEARAIGRQNGLSFARVIANDLVLRAAPRPVQRLATRLRGYDPDDVSALTLLRRDAVERLGLPKRWRDNGFDPRYRLFGSSAAFRAHQLFDQLQASRDIGAMSADMTGLERRDPYADRELIEFCLAVPEWLYRHGGVRRAFARAVFADRLPPEILTETKRGAQASNWFATLQSRRKEIADEAERIEGSPLASRLIDVPRLKRLITTWPADEREARARSKDYRLALARAVHVSQFIRWVEGGNG